MTLKSGKVLFFGDVSASERAHMIVRDDEFWFRLALFSTLGAGEGYMYRQIEVNDLTALIKVPSLDPSCITF